MGLGTGLVAGSLVGASYLYDLHSAGPPLTALERAAHGHLQIFGFVLPLVMGIAYHALPKFLISPLAAKWAVMPSFLCLLLSVGGYLTGIVPILSSTAAAALPVAAAAGLAATLLFGIVVWRTLAAARGAHRDFAAFLALGTSGWIAAAALAVAAQFAGPWELTGHALRLGVYDTALLGAVLPWTFGFTLRTFAVAPGMRAASPRRLRLCRMLMAGGVAARILARLAVLTDPPLPWADILGAAGQTAAGAGIVLFVFGGNIYWRRPAEEARPTDGSLQRRAAAMCLSVAVIMGLYADWQAVARNLPPEGPLVDAQRHLMTTGYLFLIITAVLTTVIPRFAGLARQWAGAATAGAALIILGVAARALQVTPIATLAPAVIGMSGYLSWSGLALTVAAAMATLIKGRPLTAADRDR